MDTGLHAELREPDLRCQGLSPRRRGEKPKRGKTRGESIDAQAWGGSVRSSDEGPVMGLERRACPREGGGTGSDNHRFEPTGDGMRSGDMKDRSFKEWTAGLSDRSRVKREFHARF